VNDSDSKRRHEDYSDRLRHPGAPAEKRSEPRVNTAIVDLIAISFLTSRDGELPPRFEKLNGFGGGSRKITYLCIRRSDIEETCSRRIQNLSACKSLNGFPPVSTFAIRKSESNPSGTVLEKLMDPGKDHRPFHI
jgi:hypothetical protein